MTSAKEKGIFKVFGDKYNVNAVTDLLTTLATEYERKDEEKENNVKAQEEKKQEKITPNVSFATRGFRFYEQDPGTEEYKARSPTPADFMQPVKQRIHQPLWNISPHEEKKH